MWTPWDMRLCDMLHDCISKLFNSKCDIDNMSIIITSLQSHHILQRISLLRADISVIFPQNLGPNIGVFTILEEGKNSHKKENKSELQWPDTLITKKAHYSRIIGDMQITKLYFVIILFVFNKVTLLAKFHFSYSVYYLTIIFKNEDLNSQYNFELYCAKFHNKKGKKKWNKSLHILLRGMYVTYLLVCLNWFCDTSTQIW